MPSDPSFLSPDLVRAFRHHYRLSPDELAQLLRVEAAELARYEVDGGPGWLRFALIGLAWARFHQVLDFLMEREPGGPGPDAGRS